jgi:hypothetical protein
MCRIFSTAATTSPVDLSRGADFFAGQRIAVGDAGAHRGNVGITDSAIGTCATTRNRASNGPLHTRQPGNARVRSDGEVSFVRQIHTKAPCGPKARTMLITRVALVGAHQNWAPSLSTGRAEMRNPPRSVE